MKRVVMTEVEIVAALGWELAKSFLIFCPKAKTKRIVL
jgi:hypothetical protein